MLLEALGSVLLGFALAWAAVTRLSHRLPDRRTVLGVGPLAGLFGAFLTHSAIGPGHGVITLLGATFVASVTLSLLLRPTRRLRRWAA
ncbi:hypothetical protein AB0M94_32230 [Streptomyces xanthochromogenes]|uniref:Integral membrane protein n=1 Tax=Streptomyces xanthochromogenes TaxID=67384 RepID=A0ABQ3A7K5_9ACTN|nr:MULTISPECIES: hypothetical protein [Streptomyces]MYV94507.1 hypothetical protein [Streptomyces sp. SID1034]GGY34703.1 hypothetical protein GCM10010326_31040 [Streptomyces xanthochromogenes]GHB19497.1 hypothetical protein GCM10010331_01790 [Streptomyces xanthochromogenes]